MSYFFPSRFSAAQKYSDAITCNFFRRYPFRGHALILRTNMYTTKLTRVSTGNSSRLLYTRLRREYSRFRFIRMSPRRCTHVSRKVPIYFFTRMCVLATKNVSGFFSRRTFSPKHNSRSPLKTLLVY